MIKHPESATLSKKIKVQLHFISSAQPTEAGQGKRAWFLKNKKLIKISELRLKMNDVRVKV